MMKVMVIVSEVLLYTSFSLLFGYYLLQIMPRSVRPELNFPKWLRIGTIIGIAVFSFIPVLSLAVYLGGIDGLSSTLATMLVNFEIGKNWTYTAALVVLLLMQNFAPYLEEKKLLLILSLVYLIGLAILVGWSGHASSLTGVSGFLLHSLHFIAIMIWTGILFIIGWFSSGIEKVLIPFLKWFTPLAIVCVAVGVLTGLGLMTQVVDFKDYAQSWLVPYGQAILFKHLLIIPLLGFAFLNGFLLKTTPYSNGEVKAVTWLRAEGMIVFLIYIVTATLGSVAPPHDIATLITREGPSKLIETVYGHQIQPSMIVHLEFGIFPCLFALLAGGCLWMMVHVFWRKKSSYLAFVSGSLFVVAAYFSLMLSIQ